MVWVVSLSPVKLIPHGLTPVIDNSGIRSLNGVGKLVSSLFQPVLYLHYSFHKASPKTISGRTSYLQVCLAFHPYPQLIREVFILLRFGPPRNFTHASSWPWVDHLVSGLLHATISPI